MSDDFIRGWRAALVMALQEPDRYSLFNTDEEGNEIFEISDKKNREMPINLKELDNMLWKAFRQGQASAATSTISFVRFQDFTKYLDGGAA